MFAQHKPQVIDLTKQLDASTEIYPGDPPFACEEWTYVAEHGYRVSSIRIGTQTGTHIDSPAHFDENGATLEALPFEQLLGRYFLLDLPACGSTALHQSLGSYKNEPILFIRATAGLSILNRPALDVLFDLPCAVWVLAGEIELHGAPPLEFHRLLARAGKFLVENLAADQVADVPKNGEVFAFPLKLTGTSGAPCRVIVRELMRPD